MGNWSFNFSDQAFLANLSKSVPENGPSGWAFTAYTGNSFADLFGYPNNVIGAGIKPGVNGNVEVVGVWCRYIYNPNRAIKFGVYDAAGSLLASGLGFTMSNNLGAWKLASGTIIPPLNVEANTLYNLMFVPSGSSTCIYSYMLTSLYSGKFNSTYNWDNSMPSSMSMCVS